jgi:site-specific recombinase XerD
MLKAFSSWLVKDEKVEDALLAKLKRYKVARRVIATLSDDESGRIFEALDTRTKLGACDYALVFLLLGIPGLEPVNCAG